MRLLERDLQTVWLAAYAGREAEVDSEGRYTGRHVPAYGKPVAVSASVSAAKGATEGTVFGTALDYDRTVIVGDPALSVDENALVWVDNGTDDDADYTIERVARTPNVTALAIKRAGGVS